MHRRFSAFVQLRLSRFIAILKLYILTRSKNKEKDQFWSIWTGSKACQYDMQSPPKQSLKAGYALAVAKQQEYCINKSDQLTH